MAGNDRIPVLKIDLQIQAQLKGDHIPSRSILPPALYDVIGSNCEGSTTGIEKKGRSISDPVPITFANQPI
jgi:hypothetical protein